MKWLPLISYVFDKLPIEKLLFHPPDERQRVKELQGILSHTQVEQPAVENHAHTPPISRETAPQVEVTHAPEPVSNGPTTQETVDHLKGRLTRFLSDFEDDLLDGGRIAGKPCDCLSKHSGKIEGVCLELATMDGNPIYSRLHDWLKAHQATFPMAMVATIAPEKYRALVPEVRAYRKEISGSEVKSRHEGRSERFKEFAKKRGIST